MKKYFVRFKYVDSKSGCEHTFEKIFKFKRISMCRVRDKIYEYALASFGDNAVNIEILCISRL